MRQPKSTHKNADSNCRQTIYRSIGETLPLRRSRIFTNLVFLMVLPQKRYNIPIKEKHLSLRVFRLFGIISISHIKIFIKQFCVGKRKLDLEKSSFIKYLIKIPKSDAISKCNFSYCLVAKNFFYLFVFFF